MNTERYERTISIGGKEYPACYTVAAYLKRLKISEKEGGISSLPLSRQHEVLLEMAMLYINGAIAARNMRDKEHPQPLITMDEILYLTTEEELAELFDAVADITARGNTRDVKTDDEEDPAKKATAE